MTLHLDERCIVIPGEDVLHVFSRRGSFDLRAKGIARLHERLLPFLNGTLDEAGLLARIPPAQSSAVRGYLDRLRSAGALSDETVANGGADGSGALEGLGSGAPAVSFRHRKRRVEVSLARPLPPARGGSVHLCFAAPHEVGPILWGAARPGANGRLTIVEAPLAGADTVAEQERRAGYARWLLRDDLEAEGASVRLFRLHAETGELERVAAVEGEGPGRARTLARQLGMVRPAELNSLPLPSATAGLSGTPGLSAFGLAYPAVADHLLRRVIVEEFRETVAFRVGDPGASRGSYRLATVKWSREMAIAGTLLDLHLELFERAAEARGQETGLQWREVNLFDEADDAPAVRYLHDVLSLRRKALSGRAARTPDGLFIYEAGAHRARSFFRARALTGVLAAVVRDVFHPGIEDPVVADPPIRGAGAWTLVPRSVRLSKVGELAASTVWGEERARFAIARLRAWGVSAWVGGVCGLDVSEAP